MTGFVMFLHAFISILLIVIILMQSGRGGGLTEGFASAESVFGARTNEFMIKATTVFAGLFLVTCLGLAVLSAQRGRSLMSGKAVPETEERVSTVMETQPPEIPAEMPAASGTQAPAAAAGQVPAAPAEISGRPESEAVPQAPGGAAAGIPAETPAE